jgi:hypothetical protein
VQAMVLLNHAVRAQGCLICASRVGDQRGWQAPDTRYPRGRIRQRRGMSAWSVSFV